MKKVLVVTLELQNFQGVKKLSIPSGLTDINISGHNDTFKTTIANAVSWLFTDKDIYGDSEFEIKTLDADNKPLHNLTHQVTTGVLINEKNVLLSKTLKEKWTKQRGKAHKEFTGHTTDYHIDEVPVMKKDWDAYISEIVDEKTFRVLNTPRYFNEKLHWKERRQMLLSIAGEVTIEDVLASVKGLTYPEILEVHSSEDSLKILKGRLKTVNENLKEIPARIDELSNAQSEAEPVDKAKLDKLHIEQTALREKINAPVVDESGEEKRLMENELAEQDAEIRHIESGMATNQREAEHYSNEISSYLKNIDTLQKEWGEIKEEKMEFTPESVCPACERPLPEDQINDATVKAAENFKAKKMEKYDSLKLAVNSFNEIIKNNESSLEEATAKIKKAREQLVLLNNEQEKLSEKIIEAEKERKRPTVDPTAQWQNRLNIIGSEIEEIQVADREYQNQADMRSRIKELEKSETVLATEYENIECQIDAVNQYVLAEVAILNQKIAAKFKIATFKMFNIQINGGVEPACVTMVDGVPYSSLNTAKRVNVGVDIINTLSEYYAISVPMVVDNLESVHELLPGENQRIKITAVEGKKLTIER